MAERACSDVGACYEARMQKPFGVVYVLVDPRMPFLPRYVGQTRKSVSVRRAQHVNAAKRGVRGHRAAWVRHLLAAGVRPLLRTVAVATSDEALHALEREWIADCRAAGVPLTNLTDGGEGTHGYRVSEELKARMRAARARPDVKAKMVAAARAKGQDSSWRAKIAAANVATKARPEVRARASRALVAAWSKPQRREAHRLLNLRRWARPGEREKISRESQARWSNPETRERMVRAFASAKAKRVAGCTAVWQRPGFREFMATRRRAQADRYTGRLAAVKQRLVSLLSAGPQPAEDVLRSLRAMGVKSPSAAKVVKEARRELRIKCGLGRYSVWSMSQEVAVVG